MNLIFDFDGTICDSFEVLVQTVNLYLKRYRNTTISAEEIREKGIEELIKEYKVSKLKSLFFVYHGRKEFGKHIDEFKIFSGLKTVLIKLAKENTLGIISTNSKKNIEKFLKNNEINNLFKFIDSSPTILKKSRKIKRVIRKYKFEKKDSVYIGDEVRDILAAKETGITSVSVSWGYASKELLKKNGPNILIDDPRKLLSVGKLLER